MALPTEMKNDMLISNSKNNIKNRETPNALT